MNKFKRLNASIHEDGVDLISNLPDPVLLLILSGLTSTKESIQTSILSRRWRYLWTSLPSLDLEYDGGGWNRPAAEKSKFKNIVNRALLHRSVNLDSIHLSCSDYFSTPTLEQWIDLTVMRNVKQLDLDFWPKDDMVMPQCLVTCASLEVLRLSLTRLLISPRFSGFPALRVLKLEKVEVSVDGLVKYFLESCPLLEDLTLDDCSVDELDLLCISSPKFKKLSFIYPENEYFCGCLKLSCPKLVFLQITGQVALNYIFEGPFSLTEVVIDPNFDISSEHFDTISGSFHIISHVESLRTGLYFLYQCIDAACDPALPNLKTLELTTLNENYTVKGLKKILKICPKLESLVLTIENVNTYEEEKEDYDETEYPKLDEVGTWNLTPDVAWVEFFELNGKKPKLTIDWYDDNSEWVHVVAKWGKEARFAHYRQ